MSDEAETEELHLFLGLKICEKEFKKNKLIFKSKIILLNMLLKGGGNLIIGFSFLAVVQYRKILLKIFDLDYGLIILYDVLFCMGSDYCLDLVIQSNPKLMSSVLG